MTRASDAAAPDADASPTTGAETLRNASAFDAVLDLTGDSAVSMRVLRGLTGLELPPFHDVPSPKYIHPRPPKLSVAQLQRDFGVNYTARVEKIAPCDWQLHGLAAWVARASSAWAAQPQRNRVAERVVPVRRSVKG